MAKIEIVELSKNFDDFCALKPTSFTVQNEEFFVLLGPSGCGKTTTLRMIAGLETPSGGQILLNDKDVTKERAAKRDVAFVFQLFALYPHMTVRKNLSFPLRVQWLSHAEINSKVKKVAKMLQLEPILDSSVSGLSAGDRQRVALGRAIIRNAKAFLMDEPLGALDAEFRERMCLELKAMHNQIKATTVYVTHDQIEAISMANRICVMNQGEVLQIGTPAAVYHRPKTAFVAGFIGSPSINFFEGEGNLKKGSTEIKIKAGRMKVPKILEDVEAAQVIIGARPEHISITEKGEMAGNVYAVEYMGTRKLISVQTEVGLLKIKANNKVQVKQGENVELAFNAQKLLVFDSKTDQRIDSELFQNELENSQGRL